jgi:hypothetical protein
VAEGLRLVTWRVAEVVPVSVEVEVAVPA